MDDKIFSELVANSERLKLDVIRFKRKRTLFDKVKNPKRIFYGIAGLRGTGKTVLLLQVANKYENSLYLNTEQLLFYGFNIYDTVRYALKKGFTHFFIDEIQKHPNWDVELKLLYDNYKPTLVFSGSSAISITEIKSDLSRRVVIFNLQPLSFREFLEFKLNKNLPMLTLKDILNYEKRKQLITKTIEYESYFDEYLKVGAMPIYFSDDFKKEIYLNIVNRIVEWDLMVMKKIDSSYIEKIYKIIKFIATSDANQVSYSSIANSINSNPHFVSEATLLLSKTGLIKRIPPYGIGHKGIRKEYKLLMALPFRSVLCDDYGVQPSIGSLREEFLANHLEKLAYIKTDRKRKTPDFYFNGKIFEVGGPSKNLKQIKQKGKNAYLVVDQVTYDKNKIPLYLFGFLC